MRDTTAARTLASGCGDERKAREAADGVAPEAMREEVKVVVRSTQRVAVGGLRLQFRGWLLVLAGIIVGTIANVWQAVAA